MYASQTNLRPGFGVKPKRSSPRSSTTTENCPPRISLGLDFGTTYTGVTYATSLRGDYTTIREWEGTEVHGSKVPSKIAYPQDNRSLKKAVWGYHTDSWNSCTWFKLLLDHQEGAAGLSAKFDEVKKTGMLRASEGRDAECVCEDFLALVWNFTENYMIQHLADGNARFFALTPIDVWMTVPALWGHSTREKAKNIAYRAGFGRRPGDTIQMIAEPEAAALTILFPTGDGTRLPIVHAGETITVVDVGGGTTDVITYVVSSVDGNFEEACCGEADVCGGASIQIDFHRWMTRKFKNCYKEAVAQQGNSTFLTQFEKAMRRFCPRKRGEEPKASRVENVFMENPNSKLYDPISHTVEIPWLDMQQKIFKPTVSKIKNLIQRQIDRASKRGLDVNRIVLVGGFGDNRYLRDVLEHFGSTNSPPIKLSWPPQTQSAISRGAMIRGLSYLRPILRISRCHYGFACSMEFREGRDREEDRWFSRNYQKDMSYQRIQWVIGKGDAVPGNCWKHFEQEKEFRTDEIEKEQTFGSYALELYSCDEENAPEFCYSQTANHIATLEGRFTEEDFKRAKQIVDEDGYKREFVDENGCRIDIKVLEYDINVNIIGDSGRLAVMVQSSHDEHLVGEHHIWTFTENRTSSRTTDE